MIPPLTSKLWNGTILPDIDMYHQGRYKVHIPELHQHISVADGIWCKNRTHPNRNSPGFNILGLAAGIYGTYYPLHSLTNVLVQFLADDSQSGEIVKIIADTTPWTEMPFVEDAPPNPLDRDAFTQIFRTVRDNNLFLVNEGRDEQTALPPESIHLYYHDKQTKVIINQDGIHTFTEDNELTTIEKDSRKHVKGNVKIKFGDGKDGNLDVYVEGNVKVHIHGNTDLVVDGNVKAHIHGNADAVVDGTTKLHSKQHLDIKVDEGINVHATNNINIQSGQEIHLNSGTGVNQADEAEEAKHNIGYMEEEDMGYSPVVKEIEHLSVNKGGLI
jgi:hypothetical protein